PKNASGGKKIHPARSRYFYLESGSKSTDPLVTFIPPEEDSFHPAADNSRLSQQFHGILVAASMADSRSREETGVGHSRSRSVSDISFHSLRHTATSLLKNAGVPESVAMDIIGHDSAAISRHYTHIDYRAKRLALRKLPLLAS
ncbi:MAG TPA: tyrosine-type recombinase/integrase, partial [Opitutaceae bacterium]